MPIFEYQCKDCSSKYEVLHKSSTNQEEVSCPKCKSTNSKKLFSSFSASVDGSSNYSGSDTPYAGGSCASGMCGLN